MPQVKWDGNVCGASRIRRRGLDSAVAEIAANIVRHAYRPSHAARPFELRVLVYDDRLEARFADRGTVWEPDSEPARANPLDLPEGAWTPEDGHSEGTEMIMRVALRTSSNRAAVRMIEDVGIDRTVDYAKKMGIGELPAVPSLALGAGELSLMDITTAYGAFAAEASCTSPS